MQLWGSDVRYLLCGVLQVKVFFFWFISLSLAQLKMFSQKVVWGSQGCKVLLEKKDSTCAINWLFLGHWVTLDD